MSREHIAEVQRLKAELARRTSECEQLREKLWQMKDLLLDQRPWPYLGLTVTWEKVLRVLYRREIASTAQIFAALYGDHHADADTPDPLIIKVFICKLRSKLPPNSIETVVCRGYKLTPSGRAWLAERVEPKQAVAA
jgi:DNA-binding response OmpR family regulator